MWLLISKFLPDKQILFQLSKQQFTAQPKLFPSKLGDFVKLKKSRADQREVLRINGRKLTRTLDSLLKYRGEEEMSRSILLAKCYEMFCRFATKSSE